MSVTSESVNPYTLQCMDIWSGNQAAESEITTSGLELMVYSQPYHGESRGGDVHYVSLCASGYITRMVLADVSGHGHAVAETSQGLRALVRRFMNTTSQTRLIREINREFTALTKSSRFATAIVATYIANQGRLTLCNAGHPRPLWYQKGTGRWQFVTQDLVGSGRVSNLPLGFDEEMTYQQFRITLEEGDVLVLYTDALTEARDGDDQLLGEEGLLRIVSNLPVDSVRDVSRGIVEGLKQYSNHRLVDDDMTILTLRYAATGWRWSGLGEKLKAYAKLLRLRPV